MHCRRGRQGSGCRCRCTAKQRAADHDAIVTTQWCTTGHLCSGCACSAFAFVLVRRDHGHGMCLDWSLECADRLVLHCQEPESTMLAWCSTVEWGKAWSGALLAFRSGFTWRADGQSWSPWRRDETLRSSGDLQLLSILQLLLCCLTPFT